MRKMGTGEPLNLECEEWLDIAEWPGYQVSNLGRVKSLARISNRFSPRWNCESPISVKEKIRKQCKFYGIDRHGKKRPKPAAMIVGIVQNKKSITQYVHILVLNAFTGPCPPGMEGCHSNGDATNNRLDNLRWDTHISNVQDSIRHGTFYPKRFHGSYHPI
jgi:hypothetical protein